MINLDENKNINEVDNLLCNAYFCNNALQRTDHSLASFSFLLSSLEDELERELTDEETEIARDFFLCHLDGYANERSCEYDEERSKEEIFETLKDELM